MNRLNDYLAKSNGEGIISHTDNVVINTKKLAIKFKLDNIKTDILILSSIVHDIGKLRTKTQTYFKNGLEDSDKYKYPHNVIGWFFVLKYLKHDYKDEIANLVLWHHANYNSCENLNHSVLDIEEEISDSEIDLMKNFCKHYNIDIIEDGYNDVEGNNEFYYLDSLSRSILITSDVCASSNEDVDTLFKKLRMELSLIDDSFLESDRTIEQINIVKGIIEFTTTLIKAPTGFGKTIIGILWTMLRAKQVVWVCPTNVISESIYDDIIENLKMLNIEISVELYISGERKNGNNSLGDFMSDLIITNIDNYIKPSLSNSYGSRCLMIYDCDVIFDEPHEYESMSCALFSAYNNIMNERHNNLDVTTVMLTATEPTFRFKKVNGKEVIILPNKDEHFNSVHNEEFLINFHDDVPTHLMNGEFVSFSHTVHDVQTKYSNYDGPKLISHGRYLDGDKQYRKGLVLNNYNKNGNRDPLGVFTNQMLTTSCDYSVNEIFITAPTVKVFQQTLGRLNRWGGMDRCKIHISINKTKADSMVIGNKYENEYQEIFILELKESYDGKPFTLNEMYLFLNGFNQKHDKLRNKISRFNLQISKSMLKYIYPKKFKSNNNIKIANGNKLRRSTSSDEMYIIVRKENSDEWVTINFNVTNRIGTTKLFNEDKNTYKKQLMIIKTLDGYNKYKILTPEVIKKNAIFYDTPYPVFNYVYHEILGLKKLV